MADITYTVNQDDPNSIDGFEQFSQADKNLIGTFEVNNLFDSSKNLAELHILSLSDTLLESHYNYSNYKLLGNAQSAGKSGASILSIDPIEDSKLYGYQYGGVKLLYHFLNDLYTNTKERIPFYIESISPDRTELRLQSLDLTSDDIKSYTQAVKDKLLSQSYFNEFRLNFDNNDLFIGINIDVVESNGNSYVAVKLYEPLPTTYDLKSTTYINEIISDSVAFEVDSTPVPEVIATPTLRSPNFNLDVVDDSVVPTGYYSYNDLFSYPVNNTNSQIFSLYNEKGAEISIDHTDYSDFIHFSSAYERLVNFKYKLQLIEGYSSSLGQINTAASQSAGTTGSNTYYKNQIEGVVNNFDHYERFLYYESSSYAWPKTNTTRPYINAVSTAPLALNWYANQLATANGYDLSNGNLLINTIPSFLRDDPNNENYLTFIYMIGQHFDNLWIYGKAVTDKYDGDNRLDFGISKDLVGEALKNFGVKLYTSNNSIEDLFGSFIGQAYQSGSEDINYYITGSLTGSNTPIQPSSYDNYNKEVQKRIYHNLSHLVKTKGTERGLRALINCFGIPSDILKIKLYGGRNVNERPFYGDYEYYTSSLDKIRLDHTGSLITGNTLSSYTSIYKRDPKYTDDLHTVEIGFSPTDNVDNYLRNAELCITYTIENISASPVFYSYKNCTTSATENSTLTAGNTVVIDARSGSPAFSNPNQVTVSAQQSSINFNIDDYIGDPRNLTLDSYATFNNAGTVVDTLTNLTNRLMSGSTAYDVFDYVRLIKFFDNTIFKMVRDFIPARVTADTGIIIKPHLLQRNKAKSVSLSGSRPERSGSIGTAFIESSNGDTFGINDSYTTVTYLDLNNQLTNYRLVQTPSGLGLDYRHGHEETKFDGDFSGSNIAVTQGNLTSANTFTTAQFTELTYDIVLVSGSADICFLRATPPPGIVLQIIPNQLYQVSTFFEGAPPSAMYTASAVGRPEVYPVFPYIFTNTNFQQYDKIKLQATASNPKDCKASVEGMYASCSLQTVLANQLGSIVADLEYDLPTYFTLENNSNIGYYVTNPAGTVFTEVLNPRSHIFPADTYPPNTTVFIEARDKTIEAYAKGAFSCKARITAVVNSTCPISLPGGIRSYDYNNTSYFEANESVSPKTYVVCRRTIDQSLGNTSQTIKSLLATGQNDNNTKYYVELMIGAEYAIESFAFITPGQELRQNISLFPLSDIPNEILWNGNEKLTLKFYPGSTPTNGWWGWLIEGGAFEDYINNNSAGYNRWAVSEERFLISDSQSPYFLGVPSGTKLTDCSIRITAFNPLSMYNTIDFPCVSDISIVPPYVQGGGGLPICNYECRNNTVFIIDTRPDLCLAPEPTVCGGTGEGPRG
jgi:hypothetical protein